MPSTVDLRGERLGVYRWRWGLPLHRVHLLSASLLHLQEQRTSKYLVEHSRTLDINYNDMCCVCIPTQTHIKILSITIVLVFVMTMWLMYYIFKCSECQSDLWVYNVEFIWTVLLL